VRAVCINGERAVSDRVAQAAKAIACGVEHASFSGDPADDDFALAIGEAGDASGKIRGEYSFSGT
jgi:hypothetical protein